MRQLVIMIAMKTHKAFITALSQLPLDVNLNELYTQPPRLSAKENAQRVEFVVFEIKLKTIHST